MSWEAKFLKTNDKITPKGQHTTKQQIITGFVTKTKIITSEAKKRTFSHFGVNTDACAGNCLIMSREAKFRKANDKTTQTNKTHQSND